MKLASTPLVLAATMALLCGPALAGSPGNKNGLTLDTAKRAASLAMAQAHTRKGTIAVSIVDSGGHVIYLERDDGVTYGMADASLLKAQTAASFGFPTKTLEEQIAQGHTGLLKLPGVLPLEGGVPILDKGIVIGAIGVAGGASPEDGAAAQAGAVAVGAGE